MLNAFKNNYVQICTVLAGFLFLIFVYSCEPKVESLIHPGEEVTGTVLKIELETLLAIAKSRQADLARQNELRNMILNNIMLVAETGTISPIGALTSVFAFYGIGSAANSTKKIVKKIVKNGGS